MRERRQVFEVKTPSAYKAHIKPGTDERQLEMDYEQNRTERRAPQLALCTLKT